MIGYAKYFDSNKKMSFKVSDKKVNSKPVYGDIDKYIKTKIRSNGDKISKNFQDKKIPNENTSY